MSKLTGYPFQFSLVDCLSLLLSDVFTTNNHTTDNPLGSFPGSCPSQSFLILIVYICLSGSLRRINDTRTFRTVPQKKLPDKPAAAKRP